MVMRLVGLLPAAFLGSGCSGGPSAYVELNFDQGYYGYHHGGPPHYPPDWAEKGQC